MSIFPDTGIAGGLVIRDASGNPTDPPNVQNAYVPPAEYEITCPPTALPSDCTARIEAKQINSIVSELLALAECFDPDGPWDCNSLTNLCAAFQVWVAANTDPPEIDAYTKAEADAKFVDATGDDMTGELEIAMANARLLVNKLASGQTSSIVGMTNGVKRWEDVLGNADAESVGNLGSNYELIRYDDAGAAIGPVVNFNRASGLGTVVGDPTAPLGIATKAYVDAQIASGGGGTIFIYAADTPPAGPVADNSLWWESDTGTLYIRYNDGNSVQWVEAVPSPDLNAFLMKSGGTMTGFITLHADPTANMHAVTKQYVDGAPHINYAVAQSLTAPEKAQAQANMGVTAVGAAPVGAVPGITDGSAAAAGKVGEILQASASGIGFANNTAVNVCTITLTPGDWDVSAIGNLIGAPISMQVTQASISSVSATMNGTVGRTNTWTGPFQQQYNLGLPIPPYPFNVTVNTQLWLVMLATFNSGSGSFNGRLHARRMR